jgi:hypothetical protein
MNDNYAMNEGWDKGPVDAAVTEEARHEENIELLEQVKGPEDATQTEEPRQV